MTLIKSRSKKHLYASTLSVTDKDPHYHVFADICLPGPVHKFLRSLPS